MNNSLLFEFIVDRDNKTIIERREFVGSLDLVWEAWTNAGILDRWMAPESMRTETRTMDFREGGFWHFSISSVGGKGEKHWSRYDFQKIEPQKSISQLRAFSDSKGFVQPNTPRTRCTIVFSETSGKTLVTVTAEYESQEIFEFMARGHKEGIASCFNKLDKALEASDNNLMFFKENMERGPKKRI